MVWLSTLAELRAVLFQAANVPVELAPFNMLFVIKGPPLARLSTLLRAVLF